MKQHTTPVIIRNGVAERLQPIPLKSNEYDEGWIQKLCYENPELVPTEEIEPSFGPLVPVCMELVTGSGSVDLVFVNEHGFITLGECKLWRNPEARRQVIGQILDYAKDITGWDYSRFEKSCLKARGDASQSLAEIVQARHPDLDEAAFIDQVHRNLAMGRFLLLVIGDGIRESMEEIAEYISRHGSMHFTLSLVELPIYGSPRGDERIIAPRVLMRTVEVRRTVYRLDESRIEVIEPSGSAGGGGTTISEDIFYERLTANIGRTGAERFHNFVQELQSTLHLLPKLGRGKKLSLNLKSEDNTYNFASVQEDGEVWFYGIVTKTEELGDRQIGVDYLRNLAGILRATLDDNFKDWSWAIKKGGRHLPVSEYLSVKNEWLSLIARTLERIDEAAGRG